MLIGQLLLTQGALDQKDLDRALAEQNSHQLPQRLGAILVRHGVVSEATLYDALSRQLALPLWRRAERRAIALRAANSLAEPLSFRDATEADVPCSHQPRR